MATMMWMFLWLGFKLSNCDPLNLSCSFELDLCGWSSSGSDLWLRQNSSSTSDPQGTGPDGANEGIFYIVAEASGSNTSIKARCDKLVEGKVEARNQVSSRHA